MPSVKPRRPPARTTIDAQDDYALGIYFDKQECTGVAKLRVRTFCLRDLGGRHAASCSIVQRHSGCGLLPIPLSEHCPRRYRRSTHAGRVERGDPRSTSCAGFLALCFPCGAKNLRDAFHHLFMRYSGRVIRQSLFHPRAEPFVITGLRLANFLLPSGVRL